MVSGTVAKKRKASEEPEKDVLRQRKKAKGVAGVRAEENTESYGPGFIYEMDSEEEL